VRVREKREECQRDRKRVTERDRRVKETERKI